jgi:glutamate synthase (NADPH/NADH) small chain
MECGTPFCHGYGCPLGNFIPDWNDLVFNNEWEAALRMLQKTSNFPEFTARLCPALCESACVLGLGFEPVTVCNIELAIIEKGFKEGWVKPRIPSVRTGRRAAVIGSGPAGLAVADILNSKGHTVEVFERDEQPGGLLRFGIPDFKLEKRIIDRRIELLKKAGILFSYEVEIGVDINLRYLQKKYDAVIVAIGCREPRDLSIPGRDYNGICFAFDYLATQNRINAGTCTKPSEYLSAKDKKVVIIGGGDTGADCVGTAVRQGASEVIQIEILPKPPAERTDDMPWPVHPAIYRKSASIEEGGVQHWSVMTTEFQGRAGAVEKCCCVEAEMKDGAFVPVKGSEFELEADLVILATGFIHPDHKTVLEPLGVNLNKRGMIDAEQNGQTSVKGVFAAGDAVSGPSLIVKSIAQGRSAALSADAYLRTL